MKSKKLTTWMATVSLAVGSLLVYSNIAGSAGPEKEKETRVRDDQHKIHQITRSPGCEKFNMSFLSSKRIARSTTILANFPAPRVQRPARFRMGLSYPWVKPPIGRRVTSTTLFRQR